MAGFEPAFRSFADFRLTSLATCSCCGGKGNRTPEAFTPDCFQDSVLDQPDSLRYAESEGIEPSPHHADPFSKRARRTNIRLLSKLACRELNPEPSPYKSAALTVELQAIKLQNALPCGHLPPGTL